MHVADDDFLRKFQINAIEFTACEHRTLLIW
jgi:hypothetical protein